MQNITQDDLLQALREAMAPKEGEEGEGFRTVDELARATGAHGERIRKGLKALAGEGRLETRGVKRQAIDGRMGHVPAYRVRPA